MTAEDDARAAVAAAWKLEAAKVVASVARMVHDVGLAEELAQDALVAALEQWPADGVPANPGAWLTTTARRRAVDHIRRAQRLERKREQLAHRCPGEPEADGDDAGHDSHDVLRLMFVSCHPLLRTEARVALTLRLLGGLTDEEIARAFLVGRTVIARRVADAKRTLAEAGVGFAMPPRTELAERLSSVLEVVYLIFNEGYAATSGDDLMRPGLCLEALRLGRLLAGLAPDEAEVHGLVALMELQSSRSAARTGPSGEPVPLHEQNRGRWDQLLIRRGFAAMLRAREAGGPPGPYLLQAAIAVCHAQARTAEETDWRRIATLYGTLERLLPTPVVRLNRAVAVGMADGPAAGLALTAPLAEDPALRDYHLLPCVRADLLHRLGRYEEARREFLRAASLTANAAEEAFLRGRAAAATTAARPAGMPTLGEAVRAFLERDGMDPGTARSYGQTLRRLCRSLGDELPLAALTSADVARVFALAWDGAAARTWNRHRSALRSFAAWASVGHVAEGIGRRAAGRERARPLDEAEFTALAGRPDVALRERTLWWLLRESGAPVSTVLALDVTDLDVRARRARTRGGEGWLTWGAGTAEWLPGLLAGRRRGPVFLAERRPGPGRPPAPGDLCPETGRGRLSYERAEYLFKQATAGHTLRRLRVGPRPPSRPSTS
ncbi:DUF6596 domain-containing protein [Streptomyces mashuensis]|uniref:DUF6596 domain-containing protein n=1 Tax=Streptomyces mashuensis TaxID=33904 RepID=UPI00167E702E|nr:DUF6596 domain-containing protein [Streptomyces mashuensis]